MFTQIAKNMQFKTPLRPLLFVCAIGLLFSSCQKDGPSEQKDLIDIETRDAAWTKLSIPGQLRGTSAIYGNIDDTLVVATMYKIYMTTDKGASWQMVNDAGLGIPSFSMYKGELMALSNFQDHSTSPFLFSLVLSIVQVVCRVHLHRSYCVALPLSLATIMPLSLSMAYPSTTPH